MRDKIFLVLIACWLCGTDHLASGQDDTAQTDGDAARLHAVIQSYVDAFNAREVEKLVSHWSPDGVYTSRMTGEAVLGREAVAQEFQEMFQSDQLPKLAVATESIEFISPNVALERGTAIVTLAEDDVAESRYRVVYVKRDGAWLIDRVTEDDTSVDNSHDNSHYQNLKKLEWLVGDWSVVGDGFAIEIAAQWTKNKNFISRKYTVSHEGDVESSGLQIVGWDPKENQIRSWLFDSDGGVVTAEWTQRDDQWLVRSVATLADGGSGSFTSLLRPLEDGTCAWQKINRVIDSRLLPNIDELVMQRK